MLTPLWQAATTAELALQPAELTLQPAVLNFPSSGGTKPVTITSNISWQATSSAAAWLTIEGSNAGTRSGIIHVTASAHNTTSARTATITVTGGGLTKEVSVTQAAAPPPVLPQPPPPPVGVPAPEPDPPIFASSSYSFTQLENTAAGEVVGVVSATPTGAGSVTYSLPTDGDGRFAIDATSGALTNAVVLDYESLVSEEQANGIALMVAASDGDGNAATATITVTITDVDEAPTFSSSSYSFTQLENTDAGEVVGVVSATLTGTGSVAYSLPADGDGRFAIDATSGALTNAVVLDYESLAA